MMAPGLARESPRSRDSRYRWGLGHELSTDCFRRVQNYGCENTLIFGLVVYRSADCSISRSVSYAWTSVSFGLTRALESNRARKLCQYCCFQIGSGAGVPSGPRFAPWCPGHTGQPQIAPLPPGASCHWNSRGVKRIATHSPSAQPQRRRADFPQWR